VRNSSAPTAEESRKIGALCVVAKREAEVLGLARGVWDLHARLDGDERGPGLPEDEESARSALELEEIWKPFDGPAQERSPGEFTKLTVQLKKALAQLTRLEAAYPRGLRRPRTWQERAGDAGTWVVTRLASVLDRLGRIVVGFVVWIVRRLLLILRAIWSWFRGWLAAAELLSGLLKLAVPVVVYVLTLYGETWGSPLDILSAFAVGFAGKVGLDLGTAGISFRTGSRKEDTPAKEQPAAA
jgi:hypothetical protein